MLARIFTCYPQQTTDLCAQLQQQGYTVEVLGPDQAPDTLADLEIQLEVCDPVDVLRRATELAVRLHADIAVAPGALEASPSPEPATAAPSRLQEEQMDPIPAVPATSHEPALSYASTTETHQVAPWSQDRGEAALLEASASAPPRAARSLGAALAAFAAAAEKFFVSARDQFRESRELARVGLAQSQVLREQRLLDLARRRAEVREQVLELRAGRHVLDAYLMQLKQEAPAHVRQVHEQAAPTPYRLPAIRESFVNAWKAAAGRIHLGRRESIFAGLLSVGALLVIGLTVAAFHTRSTPAANASVPQPGGVTLQPSQPSAPAATRPSPSVRMANAKPSAQARRVSPKPSPQVRRAHAKAPKQNKAPQQEFVGTDVVVRHFPAPKPASKPTPQTQANGWKHFSDMSN